MQAHIAAGLVLIVSALIVVPIAQADGETPSVDDPVLPCFRVDPSHNPPVYEVACTETNKTP